MQLRFPTSWYEVARADVTPTTFIPGAGLTTLSMPAAASERVLVKIGRGLALAPDIAKRADRVRWAGPFFFGVIHAASVKGLPLYPTQVSFLAEESDDPPPGGVAFVGDCALLGLTTPITDYARSHDERPTTFLRKLISDPRGRAAQSFPG